MGTQSSDTNDENPGDTSSPEDFDEIPTDDAAFSAMLEQEFNGKGLDTVPTEKQIKGKPRKPRQKAAKNAKEFVEKERQKERAQGMYIISIYLFCNDIG